MVQFRLIPSVTNLFFYGKAKIGDTVYLLLPRPLEPNEYIRVATAQGKQGIWKSIFPDRENTGNLLKNIKNMFLHKEFTTNTGKI